MNTKNIWLFSFLILVLGASSQNFKGVLKIGTLLDQIKSKDTTYIVNFWATWCKPCVEELPAFDSLYKQLSGQPVKVILVSLDFIEDLDKKVIPFLEKRQVKATCFLLDETNGNDFVNTISSSWSGAIPATLFKKGEKKLLVEKKQRLEDLTRSLDQLKN
jgi:thiol-disulfide isomerase/thioredoxin